MTTRTPDQIVGAAIRARREELGLTLKDLAHGMPISLSQISRYELGDSSLDPATLMLFAKRLGCTVEELMQDLK